MVRVLTRDGIQRMNRQGLGSISSAAGGGGGLTSVALAQLTDGELGDTISDMDALVYSGSLSKWTNVSIADMATKTWADGRFLKLSGGTLTGLLKIATGSGIEDATGNGLLCYHPSGWTGVSSSQWGVGAVNSQGVIRSNDSALVHYRANTAYEVIDSKGGQTISNSLQVASVEIGHTNEINATESSNLYLQYRNTGNLVLCYNGKNVGIGNVTSPSHKLHVGGGIYSTSYVTALSDIRKKDVVGDFELRVADIAGASLIRFTWKDGHDKDIHVGGIAQEWKRLLPEAVREDADGTLSMDYGVIAVAASVSIAREVVSLQMTVKAQNKKIKSLEARLARIEKMFAINANDSEE